MPLPLVPILGLATSLIERLFPNQEERAAAKAKLQQLEINGELQAIGMQLSAILIEAQSQDKWTSRARPSFMYVIYVFVLSAIPYGLLFAFMPEAATSVTEGVKLWLAAIPGEMWGLFGVGYLGYTGARSFEKRKILDRASPGRF